MTAPFVKSPLLKQGSRVVRIDAKSLDDIGTLHHWHSTYNPQKQEREYDYRYAWVEWYLLGKRKESIFAITTPEDWQVRRERPQQGNVADHWKAGAS